MRSEPTPLRAAPRGLCFAEASMRSLCVSFEPAGIAADLAGRPPTRLHDLPDPTPPAPVVRRIPVE